MEQRARILGGVQVSIFRFSLNVSLMWQHHAPMEVQTFGVMSLLFVEADTPSPFYPFSGNPCVFFLVRFDLTSPSSHWARENVQLIVFLVCTWSYLTVAIPAGHVY